MPFFLLFLLAFLVVVAVRAPYVAGWLSQGQPALTNDHSVLALEQSHHFAGHDPMAALRREPATVGEETAG